MEVVNAKPSTHAAVDEASLEFLYRTHAGWLLREVRRRFGADQAEDLVQETFLRAATYRDRPIRNARGLLLKIALHAAFDRERRRLVRPPLHDTSADDVSTQPDQAEVVILKQAVLSLPVRERDVFVLSRFAGTSYEEIAAHRGISVKAVEARITKALKHCTAVLRRLG